MEIIAIILGVVAILLTCSGKKDKELYAPDDIPRCANCTDYADGITEGKEELREAIISRLMERKIRAKGVEHAIVSEILDMVRGL